MAKKQKRQVSVGTGARSAVATPAPSATVSTYTPSYSSRRVSTTEFKPDYSYVIADMKRIGVLAGSFFGILIVLSFFLR